MPSEEVEVQKRRTRDRHIDVFLMAIIRANPHHNPTVTEVARLKAAREALLGEKKPAGRTPTYDELERFHIATERRKGESDKVARWLLTRFPGEDALAPLQNEIDREPDSDREAARKQVPNLRDTENREESSLIDHLRRKTASKPFTSQDMADLQGLANGDSPRVGMIRDAIETLRVLGIAVEDPWSE